MPVQEDMKGMRLLARKQNNVNPEISPKNSLNELTGREWIQATCSVMYQRGLGADPQGHQVRNTAPRAVLIPRCRKAGKVLHKAK